jgi:methyl-accepting chemotaxis protein
MASTAEELSSQAEQLQDTIAFFRVNHDSNSGSKTLDGKQSLKRSEKKQMASKPNKFNAPNSGKPNTVLTGFHINMNSNSEMNDSDFEKY